MGNEEEKTKQIIDQQISAAIVAIKKDTSDLLIKVFEDNTRLLRENYELSKKLDALQQKVDAHVDVLRESCPHTTI